MATGLGTTTIKVIKREFMAEREFSSPAKRYNVGKVRLFPDDFDAQLTILFK